MTELATVCQDLAEWLPRAAALTSIPDTTSAHGRGKPGSQPPWNPAAATALYDALETIRRLEQMLREDLAGHPCPRRPPSRTGTSLHAIQRLAEAADAYTVKLIAVRLQRHIRVILQLPAIGEDEQGVQIANATCPNCGLGPLIAWTGSARVACSHYGACLDRNGEHPRGVMEDGLSGKLIAWADGTIQHPAEAALCRC